MAQTQRVIEYTTISITANWIQKVEPTALHMRKKCIPQIPLAGRKARRHGAREEESLTNSQSQMWEVKLKGNSLEVKDNAVAIFGSILCLQLILIYDFVQYRKLKIIIIIIIIIITTTAMKHK